MGRKKTAMRARLIALCLLHAALHYVIAQDADSSGAGDPESSEGAGDKDSHEKLAPQIATAFLNDMLKSEKYDPYMAPGNSLIPPQSTDVYVSIGLLGIHSVSIVDGTFQTSLWTNMRFKDHRLRFSSKNAGVGRYVVRGFDLNKMWEPIFYVSHTISSNDFGEKYIALNSIERTPADGRHIRYQTMMSYLISELFDVSFFPFDVQMFQIKFGQTNHMGGVTPRFGTRFGGGPLWLPPQGLTASGLKCGSDNATRDCVVVERTTASFQSGSYAFLNFKFYLKRNWESYIMTLLIPLQVIWAIAYTTYWQDPEGNGGRDGISITAFLAMVFYQIEVKGELPRVEYVTWMEVYTFVYTVIVGASAIEFVVVIVNFRDDGPYDKIISMLNGTRQPSRKEIAKLAEDDEDAELKMLLNRDDIDHDDVLEKYFAVSLDRKFRFYVPIVTLIFNVFMVLWPLLDTTSIRMPS